MKDCNRHLTLSYAIAMRTNTKRLVQLHAKAKRRSGTSRPSLSCAWTQPWGAQLAITSLFVPATVTKKQKSFHNPTAELQAHVVKGRRQASGPRSTPRSKCATTVPSGACRTECQTHRAEAAPDQSGSGEGTQASSSSGALWRARTRRLYSVGSLSQSSAA